MKTTLLIIAAALLAGCQTKPVAVDPRDAEITTLSNRLASAETSLNYVTNAYPLFLTALQYHTTNSEHRLDLLEATSTRLDK